MASPNFIFRADHSIAARKRWIRERVVRGDLTSKKVGLWTRGEVRIAPFRCYAAPPIVPSTPKRKMQRPPNDIRPKEGQRKAFKIEDADFEALLARFSSDESLQGAGIKSRGVRGGIVSGPLTRDGIRFIDSTPSRETSVVRPVCAPVSLDYDEIWMRSPSDKAMAAMVASEVAERLMRTTHKTASSHEGKGELRSIARTILLQGIRDRQRQNHVPKYQRCKSNLVIGKQSLSWLSEHYNSPTIATHRSDLCADLWVRAKMLAPVAEELGLFTRPSVNSKRCGARIETLV